MRRLAKRALVSRTITVTLTADEVAAAVRALDLASAFYAGYESLLPKVAEWAALRRKQAAHEVNRVSAILAFAEKPEEK